MHGTLVLLALGDARSGAEIERRCRAAGHEVIVRRGVEALGADVDPQRRTTLIVDPGLAPGEDGAGDLVGRLVRGFDRVVAMATPALDEAALLALGVAEVFRPETPAGLVVQRGLEGAARPAGSYSLERFHARVGVQLQRARERERPLAVFCVRPADPSASGLLLSVEQAVHEQSEALDDAREASLAPSRMLLSELDDGSVVFCVPSLHLVHDAARLGRRLQESLASEWSQDCRVGISCSPDDGVDAASITELARVAARGDGDDGSRPVRFHNASMERWAFERLALESSLRSALENGEITVFYQPRVDIETREVRGMEALVRWQHPELGLVSPARFIPIAEETGLIVPIGEWVLREACRQNAAWRAEGIAPIRVSVNLSSVQFRAANLEETVAGALEDAGLDPDGLELEVTESLLMDDPREAAATLGRLRSRGVHISIDDFGTGYSSLAYLKSFPVDALKIDRTFITDVTGNPSDAAIATAIILMGHSLNLKVVAEGVETENQFSFLQVLQCNEVQGYLFSAPVPAERARALLTAPALEARDAA